MLTRWSSEKQTTKPWQGRVCKTNDFWSRLDGYRDKVGGAFSKKKMWVEGEKREVLASKVVWCFKL